MILFEHFVAAGEGFAAVAHSNSLQPLLDVARLAHAWTESHSLTDFDCLLETSRLGDVAVEELEDTDLEPTAY